MTEYLRFKYTWLTKRRFTLKITPHPGFQENQKHLQPTTGPGSTLGNFCHHCQRTEDQARVSTCDLKLFSVSHWARNTADESSKGLFALMHALETIFKKRNTRNMFLKFSCHLKMESQEIQKRVFCCAVTQRKAFVFYLCCSEMI